MHIHLSQAEAAERDDCYEALLENNRRLRSLIRPVWDAVIHVLQAKGRMSADEVASDPDFKEALARTSYTVEEGFHLLLKVGEPPDEVRRICPEFSGTCLGLHLNAREELTTEIDRLERDNARVLAQLCRLHLQGALGGQIRGVYPHAAADCDLVCRIGGDWLLVDDVYPEYERVLRQETELAGKGIDEGAIHLLPLDPFHANVVSAVRRFRPNVLLLKYPGGMRTHDELARFYREAVGHDLMAICNERLTTPGARPSENIAGLVGIGRLRSESLLGRAGLGLYPLDEFFIYELRGEMHPDQTTPGDLGYRQPLTGA